MGVACSCQATQTSDDVVEVELHKQENSSAHHTEDFQHTHGLVVRRGQSFFITVTTDKQWKESQVPIKASFQLVSQHATAKVASFEQNVLSSVQEGKLSKLELEAPADACIGKYFILLTCDNNGREEVLQQDISVIILFNPWCTEDSCSYPTISDLEEYILNTSGRIWAGSANSHYGRPWQYCQFSDDCLDVALWVMDKMAPKHRGDPVMVSRHVSAMTNVQDDNGILVGNWSGDYSGGTSPLKWTGSGPILAQFNTNKSPVRYGQCWVFSGVQTSLLRCLGLPTRSVTNFNSAHDTNFNRAVDKFYDEDGKPSQTSDSIWNFHVWNESWMSRPDLEPGFGGWQALDATPQERSPQGGGYRLGPTPVRAVKLGKKMDYDVEFVISEVNADVRSYIVMADGSRILSNVNTSRVGKWISTKAVGGDRRHDLTEEYKFPEGSSEERAALLAEADSLKIGIDIDVNCGVCVGDDVVIKATVTNKSSSDKNMKIHLLCQAVLYTGAPGKQVKVYSVTDPVKNGQKKNYNLQVSSEDYRHILADGKFLNFVCIAVDHEAKQSAIQTETIHLKTHDVKIELPEGGLKLHEPAEITVSFKNPLKVALSECQFEIRGDGHVQDIEQNVESAAAFQMVSTVLKTTPVKKGKFQLQVVFSSIELTDIIGVKEVKVK